MEFKSKFTRSPYLVLFVVLIAIGVGTASAIITITLSGNVVITGDLDMTNDKIRNVAAPTTSSDVATKGYVDSAPSTDTLGLLGCSTSQIAKWDGTQWVCEFDDNTWNSRIPQDNQITTIDGMGFTLAGRQSAITIGEDGFPVVAYSSGSNTSFQDLKVLKCTNPACSSGNIITTVDSSGNSVGRSPSIAIAPDGNPVIVYIDGDNVDLKLLKCGNSSCSSGNTGGTIFDSSGTIGASTSLTFGTDGFPIIGFYHGTDTKFKILKCDDALCTSNSVILSGNANTGIYSTISNLPSTKPLIMGCYYDSTNSKLLCLTSEEDGFNPGIDDGSLVNQGRFPSMTITNNLNPIVSFIDENSQQVRVVTCILGSCDENNTEAIDFIGSGTYASTVVSINGLGLPVVSYYAPDGRFFVTACHNNECSNSKSTTILDETSAIASIPEQTHSMAVGPDGNPVMSYHDATEGSLKIAKCGNPTCIPNFTRR
jgi:hypothetical protein